MYFLERYQKLMDDCFQDKVWVDFNSSYKGTDFPVGTRHCPVNNMDDAREIQVTWDFDEIKIIER